KALCDVGFLTPAAGGGYVLGPRFIEFDRQIRVTDPLLKVAQPIVASIRNKVAGTTLVSRYYANRVLSILRDQTDPEIAFKYDRGTPFPMFRGSPSKIILAHLAPYQLRNLMLNYRDEIAEAGLGETWPELRDSLRAIRKLGYHVGSDLDPTL